MNRAGYRMRRDHQGSRRKVVTIDGVDGYVLRFSRECSGCTERGGYGGRVYGPFGCEECGYTGRVRIAAFVPFDETP